MTLILIIISLILLYKMRNIIKGAIAIIAIVLLAYIIHSTQKKRTFFLHNCKKSCNFVAPKNQFYKYVLFFLCTMNNIG